MQLVISVLNLLGLGGLAVFIYLVWKGLRERITNLTVLAEEQKQTLEAVRARATELDQMRKDYKQGLDDYQELGTRLNERHKLLVIELEAAIQRKDEQLACAKQLELKDLELQQQSLALLPELQERLATTAKSLEAQINILSSATNRMRPYIGTYDDVTVQILARAGIVLYPHSYPDYPQVVYSPPITIPHLPKLDIKPQEENEPSVEIPEEPATPK